MSNVLKIFVPSRWRTKQQQPSNKDIMNALQSLQTNVATLQGAAALIVAKLQTPPTVVGVAEADVQAQADLVAGVANVLNAALNAPAPVPAPAP